MLQCIYTWRCAACRSDLSLWLADVMSIVGCKCHINPCTLTDHKPWVWTWCFDLHPRTKTKRQKGLSAAGAGKGSFNGDRKSQWLQFSFKTVASLCLVCHFFRLCVILNGSLQTLDTLSKSHTYIENTALAQCALRPGHSCKKYDFLPVGNFLFMSVFGSIEGDSGRYLIHCHLSPEVTPVLMTQDAMESFYLSSFLNCLTFFLRH